MSDHHYPELDEKSLRLVMRLVRAHPKYLTDPACPYSEQVKDLFSPKQNETEDEDLDVEFPTVATAEKKVLSLIKELEQYGKDNKEATAADKNTYFRLSATLLKDLAEMLEKLSQLKEHENFVSTILSILDEICDADQKAIFRDRLEKFNKGAPNEETPA